MWILMMIYFNDTNISHIAYATFTIAYEIHTNKYVKESWPSFCIFRLLASITTYKNDCKAQNMYF